MNIFILDIDPKKAAKYHCDKHVVKMITEYSQIISTVVRNRPFLLGNLDFIFKSTHKHHPCTLWIEKDMPNGHNMAWLIELLEALINEYHHRFGINDNFKRSKQLLAWVKEIGWKYNEDNIDFHHWPLAMPDECKVELPKGCHHPVESYRRYYREQKQHLHKWTKRETPVWL